MKRRPGRRKPRASRPTPWEGPRRTLDNGCAAWRKARSLRRSSRRINFNRMPTERAIMADQTFRTTDKTGMPSNPGSVGNAGSASYGFDKAGGAGKAMGDQAKGMTEQ